MKNLSPSDHAQKIFRLRSLNSHSVGKDNYERIVDEYFIKKCPKSKALHSESRLYIPGGTDHAGITGPFPLYFAQSDGAHLTDVDGNVYIDLFNAGGASVLGVGTSEMKSALLSATEELGAMDSLPNEYEIALARALNGSMPYVEALSLMSSREDSYNTAIDLARTVTGKKRTVVISSPLLSPIGDFVTRDNGRAATDYVSSDLKEIERLLRLNRMRGGTAAVIVEPLGIGSGMIPADEDFLPSLAVLVRKYGAAFIADESVSAYRIAPGGACGTLLADYDYLTVDGRNMYPDLVLLGQSLSTGYVPFFALGGKKDFMQRISGASERNASFLSSILAYRTIKSIESSSAITVASELGDRLTAGLVKLIDKYDLPFLAYNVGPIVHLETEGLSSYTYSRRNPLEKLYDRFSGEKKKRTNRILHTRYMNASFISSGIITAGGATMFLTASHTPSDVDRAVKAFDRAFKLVFDTGSYKNS